MKIDFCFQYLWFSHQNRNKLHIKSTASALFSSVFLKKLFSESIFFFTVENNKFVNLFFSYRIICELCPRPQGKHGVVFAFCFPLQKKKFI